MKKHYDVCIAGFWYGANYGSLLNGYAEYCLLKEFGKEVLMLQKPNASLDDQEIVKGHNVKFVKKYYDEEDISPALSYDRLTELNDICDCFCAGSDQIWNHTLSFHENLYLPFVRDDKKLISFATSFGHKVDKVPLDRRDTVRKYLKRYSAISVREQFDVDILKDNYGINGTLVFEPVFCIDKKYYLQLIENSKFNETEPYLLTYILDPTPEKREAILYYQNKLGIKVVNILNGVQWAWNRNKELLNLPNTIPDVEAEDFLKAFMNASYVITDSFHGSAFSIIFNKPFLAIGNYGRGYERFIDLLGRLKLMDRLVTDPKNIPHDEKYLKAVDYTVTNQIIEQEAKRTVEWFKIAVNTPKDELDSICYVPNRNILNKKRSVIDIKKCTGCGSCISSCPKNAIEMFENNEGFLNPIIDFTKCINCGLCEKKCPVINPKYSNYSNPECFAVMANDEIRNISSSGGMFSIVAKYILQNGGYVCGAAYENDFKVEHCIINDVKDLDKLRGSKYIQSNTKNTYKEVKQLLMTGKQVLYTGTPCQIAGLNAYLGKEYNNLYTIDILCHGISSHKVFSKYHKDIHNSKILTDVKFKEKSPWGWHAGINAYFIDGTKYSQPLEKDAYFRAYLGSISKNTTCGICKFNVLPRQGDLTIGDFWRIEKFRPELNDNKGTSVVLVNNDKGMDLFNLLQNDMQIKEKAPIEIAKSGNRVIVAPYVLSKYRDSFFDYLDEIDFELLTNGCKTNRFFDVIYNEKLNYLSQEQQEWYFIARTVAKNCGSRRIVTWGYNSEFNSILEKEFGKRISFKVTERKEYDNGKDSRYIDILKNRNEDFYLVSVAKNYDVESYKLLESYGYKEINDFIYRIPKTIIIENFDCSKQFYCDAYGNTVEGVNGIIKKIVFKGYNNHIIFGSNIIGTNNISISMCANSTLRIDDGCKFSENCSFVFYDYKGSSFVNIRQGCVFGENTNFTLCNDINNSSVLINEGGWFGSNFEVHTNLGKKVIVGKNCLASHEVELWGGDAHSIFDVKTGKNINRYSEKDIYKNQLVIGEHVWLGKRAFILYNTNIGMGSIVGACSVVKGIYPNNCIIAGNPSKLIKTDIAWSGKRGIAQMEQGVASEYSMYSSNAKAAITGRKVLVIGGTKFMGVKLVKNLIELGNDVTIATRGNRKDSFGTDVKRLKMDVSDAESVKKALEGKYFDIIFDNLAYCSNYVKNILSVVRCGKYIQLSSVESYIPTKIDLRESDFNPYISKQEWCDVNVGYQKGKQQAEIAVYQMFPNISAVTVRIPYVVPTDRLLYYCNHIINQIPMNIDDVSRGFTFIRDTEVGRFLPWIAAQNYEGPINLASTSFVTIKMILEYIENKVGKKAIIDMEKGDTSPFHVFDEKTFSMNMSKAEQLGYKTSDLNDWLWNTLDTCIEKALKQKNK